MRPAARSRLLFFAALATVSGCNTSNPDDELAAGVAASASALQAQEFDFGRILADGRTVAHDFALRNPTSEVIHLLNASSSTPCCTTVGPLPKLIPAGGTVRIPIKLKTTNKVGPLRVNFVVESDKPTPRVFRLTASAMLVPEWKIEADGQPLQSLALGACGKVAFRISCNRTQDDGSRLPSSISASGEVNASMPAGGENETRGPNGIVESTANVLVELYPSLQAGRHSGEIRFHWPDGKTRSHILNWEVRPGVKATPAGVVIRPSTEPVSVAVIIESEDRDIRIVKVEGPPWQGHSLRSRALAASIRSVLWSTLPKLPEAGCPK
jgi:Protein of unknown function (DUF1573)